MQTRKIVINGFRATAIYPPNRFVNAEFIAAETEVELNIPDDVDVTGKEIDAAPVDHGRARQDAPSTSGLVLTNLLRAEKKSCVPPLLGDFLS
jgi:hypothetical protein